MLLVPLLYVDTFVYIIYNFYFKIFINKFIVDA